MPKRSLVLVLVGLFVASSVFYGVSLVRGAKRRVVTPPPAWAYAVTPGPPPVVRELPNVPDLHPTAHPAMPDVVAHGPSAARLACAFCHLPNGLGRPENASLAGLPAAYIEQQLADFKSGARRSSEHASLPVSLMTTAAQAATEEEVRAAAAYFASFAPKPWIRVVEADTVPKTQVVAWMFVATTPAETEPLGARILEMAEDAERTAKRDDASGFVAYVPIGSIARGEALVTSGGGGRTMPCATCHGAGWKGLGAVPSIVGRSPSYVVRQLYDLQQGTRHGQAAALMNPVVALLREEDMVAIAAFLASRAP